jgi:hypothetical protein
MYHAATELMIYVHGSCESYVDLHEHIVSHGYSETRYILKATIHIGHRRNLITVFKSQGLHIQTLHEAAFCQGELFFFRFKPEKIGQLE